jgi:uncharacterized protein YecT (DUF1311 family)
MRIYAALMTCFGLRRRIRVILVATGICVGAGLHAGAQERVKAPGAPCRGAGSPNLTTQCFVANARRADRDLMRMLRVLSIQLKPEEYEKLQAAEQHWYLFRSANCEAEQVLYTQTSTASLAYAACAEAETRQRVDELKVMYAWLFK